MFSEHLWVLYGQPPRETLASVIMNKENVMLMFLCFI